MKVVVAITVVVGVALGSLGTQFLQAQKTPAGYFVGEVFDVSNQEQYSRYAAEASRTIEQYGGRYIVRGGKTSSLEGDQPKRIVVLAFDSLAAAERWYHSPEYSAITPLRTGSSTARAFLVEGVAP